MRGTGQQSTSAADSPTFSHSDECANSNGEPHADRDEYSDADADVESGHPGNDRDKDHFPSARKGRAANQHGPDNRNTTSHRYAFSDCKAATDDDVVSYISAQFREYLMQSLQGREALRRHMHRNRQNMQRTAWVRLIARWLSVGEQLRCDSDITALEGDTQMAHAIIEGHECTLYVDYDQKVLPLLTDDGKIEWLQKRIEMILLSPLGKLYDRQSIAFRDLHDPEGDPPMTHLFLITSAVMNGIEALGSFLTPPKPRSKGYKDNPPNFSEFVKEYMPKWAQLSGFMWKEYRNGLAHSCAIKRAALDGLPSCKRYDTYDGLVHIDPDRLFCDFAEGVLKMFEDIRRDPRKRSLFLTQFKDVYGY